MEPVERDDNMVNEGCIFGMSPIVKGETSGIMRDPQLKGGFSGAAGTSKYFYV